MSSVLLRKQEPRLAEDYDRTRLLLSQEHSVRSGYVYLMASRRNGTPYLGVTSNLPARAYQHRNRLIVGFSKKYGCLLLVWFEACDDIQAARARELQMKKWKRAWKVDLIEATNPQWRDLYDTLF